MAAGRSAAGSEADEASTQGDDGRAAVAEEASLRRIEVLIAGYGVVAATVFAVGGSGGGVTVLTLLTVGSILALRGVEGFVRRLRVAADGEVRGGAARILLPWALLVVALGAALVLGSEDVGALVIGASLLPAALMTEAVIQTVRRLTTADRGDAGGGRDADIATPERQIDPDI